MTRLNILTAVGILGPLGIGAAVAWLIKRAGILDPLKKLGSVDSRLDLQENGLLLAMFGELVSRLWADRHGVKSDGRTPIVQVSSYSPRSQPVMILECFIFQETIYVLIAT
jgi:hypothetical protein